MFSRRNRSKWQTASLIFTFQLSNKFKIGIFLICAQTTGDGNSKKVAKKHAAENMLNELKKLPPLRVANELQANGRRKNFGGKRNAPPNSRQQVQ